MLPGIFFFLLFPSFVEKHVTYPHDPLWQSTSCLTTKKRHEQNSVPVQPTKRHWHFLRSLQCRCVMCLSSCGVSGFWNNVASSSLTVQPFPMGFQRSAFERWLWHHTADTILLKHVSWKHPQSGRVMPLMCEMAQIGTNLSFGPCLDCT